jgi:hypothetical protein
MADDTDEFERSKRDMAARMELDDELGARAVPR